MLHPSGTAQVKGLKESRLTIKADEDKAPSPLRKFGQVLLYTCSSHRIVSQSAMF